MQGLSGAGAALAPPPPPNRPAIGPKKARDLGPAEKRAPSPNGSTRVRHGGGRSVSLPTPQSSHVRRQRATTDNYYYYRRRRRRSPDNCRSTRAPRCRPVPIVHRRTPSPDARTRIHRRRSDSDPSERVCSTGERSSVVGLRATLPGVE